MIFELRIKNFLSYKGEETLSFEATDDTDLEETHVVEVAPGVRILRLAVVYGANASGKSNLFSVFSLLGNFWFRVTRDKNERLGITPFLFDDKTKDEPSEFALEFYAADRKKYVYELKADDEKVHYEALKLDDETKQEVIFERTLNNNVSEIFFNDKLIAISPVAKEEISIKCLCNMSVFAAYNAVNFSSPELDVVMDEISKLHYISPIGPDSDLIHRWQKILMEDSANKEYLLDFLKRADYNISDFNVKNEKVEFPEMPLNQLMNLYGFSYEYAKKIIENNYRADYVETKFDHEISGEGGHETRSLDGSLESLGTLRTIVMAGAMKRTLDRGSFLAIDEIESSLHPRLLEFFIDEFLSRESEAQLLFTTHYDGLLDDERLLRKDNVWFTQKREDGSTELYSLSDFKDVDKLNYLDKAYKYGRFGAVPNL